MDIDQEGKKTRKIIAVLKSKVVVHPPSNTLDIRGSPLAGIDHDTDCITYRCFLPDLTRFVTVCCAAAGPGNPRSTGSPPGGVQPRISGFRVEGTANSPPSTTGQSIPCPFRFCKTKGRTATAGVDFGPGVV